MTFKRTIEDFVCEHCSAPIKGSGYTNHCPVCLWSKHVDITPGDRAEKCGGLMEPFALEGSSPEYVLVHRCAKCGTLRRVRTDKHDSTEAIIALAKHKASQ